VTNPAGAPAWRVRSDGLSLSVRLTPKSSRDAIDGIEILSDGRAVLKVRVRAMPEAGEANAALVRLLAKSLKIPGSAIGLESGATTRLKVLRITGDSSELATRLAALLDIEK
jgi:uncharacterized protein (TIGR00251 family)